MKVFILVDHANCVAFETISERDARAYMATEFPGIHMPSTDSLEGDHNVGADEYVSIVFIDDVAGDKYHKLEGSYNEISQFIEYDSQFDDIEQVERNMDLESDAPYAFTDTDEEDYSDHDVE